MQHNEGKYDRKTWREIAAQILAMKVKSRLVHCAALAQRRNTKLCDRIE